MNWRLENHRHYRENADGTKQETEDGAYISVIEPGCAKCRQKFEKTKSVCAFCLAEVCNKDFLKNDYHQSGKCKARYIYKIPAPNWSKPLPYPMPKMPDYYDDAAYFTGVGKRNGKEFTAAHGSSTGIQTYADLAKWWGLPMIGGSNGS